MWSYLILILGVALFYMYNPYFQQIQPIEYSTSLPLAYEGPMTVNNKLDSVQRLYENEIHWPESFALRAGHIYTGLGDGRIVMLAGKNVKNISRTGIECEGQHEEAICGRPLGMQFDKAGQLYVVDAYLGLFVIDVKTGNKKQLLPSSQYVDSKPLTFLNDLTIDEEERIIYITQSSSKWNISKVIVSILEHDSSGRLLKYDIKQKTVSVLADGLAFPNGVLLSHDKQSLLVAEGSKNRIHKYHIRGAEKGQLKPVPLLLPGEPDNISHSKRGHYWVATSSARTAGSPTIYDRFSHYPLVRKGILMAYHILMAPVTSALRLTPSVKAKELAFEMLGLRAVVDLFTPHSVIIEFDENGSIVQSLHSPSGKIAHISEILEHNGYLYLGSWRNRFLGKVRI